jgi:hypothetical protein
VDLAYVAHSSRCALLLDSEGICRWVVPKADPDDPEASQVIGAARRCVGAQYVATLDPEAEGLLCHEPRVGKTMLFATVTRGRVALVRFGPLVRFESLDEEARATPAPERTDDAKPDEAKHPELAAPEPARDPDVITNSAHAAAFSGSSDKSTAEQTAEQIEELSSGDVEAEGSGADEAAAGDEDEDAKDRRQEIVALAGLSSPALASFLDDVEKIADLSYPEKSVQPAEPEDESEIELTTGSFGPVSVPIVGVLGSSWEGVPTRVINPADAVQEEDDDSAEKIELADDPLEPEEEAVAARPPPPAELDTQRPLRPSGFVMRRVTGKGEPTPERETTPLLASTQDETDDEAEVTSRFSRAAGSKDASPSETDIATARAPASRLAPRRLAP